jgi:iron complex transport system substrate-binding protein
MTRSRPAAVVAWIVLSAVLATTGCSVPRPSSDPEPAQGGPPLRIVSLSPALTEIVFALGLGDRVVGVTTYCDWPPEARTKPKIGGFVNPSVEAVLQQRPDLVLVSPAAGNREAALAARRAGARMEVLAAETIEDAFHAIRRIAELGGAPERGEALAEELSARLEAVARRVRGRPRVPVLFCLQLDPIIAAGRGTLPSELLELAGGENIVQAERYPQVGIETVLAREPRVILQSRMDTLDDGALRSARAYWSRWSAIPAVHEGRVVEVDGGAALRAGPRIAEAAERIASILHPEEPQAASTGDALP